MKRMVKKSAPSVKRKGEKNKPPTPPKPFIVTIYYAEQPKDYEYLYESDAVLFACRYSRDLGVRAEVLDFEGSRVVEFLPRSYDLWARNTETEWYKTNTMMYNYDLRMQHRDEQKPVKRMRKSK